MKLELKHLVSYLPYDLKGIFLNSIITLSVNYFSKGTERGYDISAFLSNNIKPILFPLSSLTKDDVKNFYQFNNDDFKSIDLKEWAEDLMFFIKTKEPFQLSQFEYLLSKKFDVFGLIEAGLAEPVTEDFNPYK